VVRLSQGTVRCRDDDLIERQVYSQTFGILAKVRNRFVTGDGRVTGCRHA
jgi:hypothetical protein